MLNKDKSGHLQAGLRIHVYTETVTYEIHTARLQTTLLICCILHFYCNSNETLLKG